MAGPNCADGGDLRTLIESGATRHPDRIALAAPGRSELTYGDLSGVVSPAARPTTEIVGVGVDQHPPRASEEEASTRSISDRVVMTFSVRLRRGTAGRGIMSGGVANRKGF